MMWFHVAMADDRTRDDRPAIFSARDPRALVRDLVAWRRRHDSRLSYRRLAFAADLGSPNYVQLFVQGRRHFKPATAARVARALGLNRAESEYFVLLVRFAQARDVESRRRWYRDLLQQAVRHGSGAIDFARLEYFSAWYVPVVHAMASLHGFAPDPAAIAARVVPAIRRGEAEHALQVLGALGVLVPDGAGGVTLHEPQLETTPEIQSVWIGEYHQAMIALAGQAALRWDRNVRNVSALTVTVAREQVDWLIQRIDAFRNELFAALMAGQHGDPVTGDVYQINLQAFPLTTFHVTPRPNAGEPAPKRAAA